MPIVLLRLSVMQTSPEEFTVSIYTDMSVIRMCNALYCSYESQVFSVSTTVMYKKADYRKQIARPPVQSIVDKVI